MSFTPFKFLGATVKNYSGTLGLNSNKVSQCTIRLVEDLEEGDLFNPPGVGTPVYFQHFDFFCYGLLQKWEKNNDASSGFDYEVVIEDPKSILDGVQVILNEYSGSTYNVKNVLNVFGFWESFGFGGALVNETGMPWYRIRNAALLLMNTPVQTTYGGPMVYRGFKYGLNLSRVPNPPVDYRIPGGSASLLDIIAAICEDGGHDFFVTLVGSTIVVNTIPRLVQPPLGTISAIVNDTYSNLVKSSSSGVEARNEHTTTFLVGGKQSTLHLNTTIASFWGFDVLGAPILGIPYTLNLFTTTPDPDDPDDPTQDETTIVPISTEFVSLNATPVADILGQTAYTTTTFEMRLALAGKSSWMSYIGRFRVPVSHILGLNADFTSPIRGLINRDRINTLGDFVNQGAEILANTTRNFFDESSPGDQYQKIERLYQFVLSAAQTYYGRQYAVSVPFVLTKFEPGDFKVVYSQEPTDGGWLPDGATPLGLSTANADLFQLQDGRFTPFVQYPGSFDNTLVGPGWSNPLAIDISRLSGDSYVLEQNGTLYDLYIKVGLSGQTIATPSPAVVITLPEPVFEKTAGLYPNFSEIRALLNMPTGRDLPLAQEQSITAVDSFFIAPNIVKPTSAAIPLKSNILTYGPWYLEGVPGKVKYEQDSSLVPWNYGGFTNMVLAATAKLANSASNMQVSESGYITVAGTPQVSMGSSLILGGPNVTDINVNVSPDGVTTTYRFQTFTPRFGVFNRGMSEKIRFLGNNMHSFQRELKQNARDVKQTATTIGKAAVGWWANDAIRRRQSPHQVIIGFNVQDGDDAVRPLVATSTYPEVKLGLRGDDNDEFSKVAMCSWDALLRPIFTGTSDTFLLPPLHTTLGDDWDTVVLNNNNLSPWKGTPEGYEDGHNFQIYTWGQTPSGLNAYVQQGSDVDISRNARVMALRGPLVISGWGYANDGTTGGKLLPTGIDKPLLRSDKWKTGPVDLMWDEDRAVWTSHDIIRGVVTVEITAASGGTDGTGQIGLVGRNTGGTLFGGATGTSFGVKNMFATAISVGVAVLCGFCAHTNEWYVIAADC